MSMAMLTTILLFLIGLKGLNSAEVQGLTQRLYANTALVGTPISTTITPIPIIILDGSIGPSSGELSGTITFSSSSSSSIPRSVYNFTCNFSHTSTGWVWIDGHQVCNDGNSYRLQDEDYSNSYDNPLPIKNPNKPLPFRAHITNNKTDGPPAVSLTVTWKDISIKNDSHHLLSPNLPPAEQKRDNLQRSMSSNGWGNWLHHDMLSLVKLPEGLVIIPQICRKSTLSCITSAKPDDGNTIRVGLHAWDRSYVQTYVGRTGLANVSIEYSSSGYQNKYLHLLITPVHCSSSNSNNEGSVDDCSDYEIQLKGRYAWFRAGSISANANDSMTFDSAGLGLIEIHSTTSSTSFSNNDSLIVLPLTKTGESIGISTSSQFTVEQIALDIKTKREREETRLRQMFGNKADVASAVQAAVMWTLIYNPAENNGPIMPVSRSWSCTYTETTSDWTYCIFEWDTFFASLIAGLGSSEIAYSNLFQVVKGKTPAGFIPNYNAGGMKSLDRSQPPVGSKVTLELYHKFKDSWIIHVVFDDLLEWNNWFYENRVLEPAGLVALGSWNAQAALTKKHDNRQAVNDMHGARLESGLDNSPMYDGEFFDSNTTHLMQLYDVGMSSMFVQDSFALADLANVIGRHAESQMLRSRGDAMATKIQTHLWDPVGNIYTNKFPNETFYRRISPTSFYAMQSCVPTDSQASSMVLEWLMNSSRFCVSPKGDFSGNGDTCYWGLPSISAADSAFYTTNFIYWRGYVWGPMAMLTYWSLQNYDHVPIVRQGRKALCQQMEALMMNEWYHHHHIHENYDVQKTSSEGSGWYSTSFYHWGALTGLIGLMEDGLYNTSTLPSLVAPLITSASTTLEPTNISSSRDCIIDFENGCESNSDCCSNYCDKRFPTSNQCKPQSPLVSRKKVLCRRNGRGGARVGKGCPANI